jgi:hypothetical protein
MTKNEIAEAILRFGVQKAYLSAENMTTGVLTQNVLNPLSEEKITELSLETEYRLRALIAQYSHAIEGDVSSDQECGLLFQYVFDRVVEVTYKTIIGKEIDTKFLLIEPFESYEIDLPYYIQQKLTNQVGRLACLCGSIIEYMDKNGFREENLGTWMLPFLMVPTYIAIRFAQEMDFDRDIDEHDKSFGEGKLDNHECLIVLNEIAKKALITIGEEAMDPPMVDLMGKILLGINSGESDELIAVKAIAEFMLSGYALDEVSIKEISKNTREKCQKHLFALQIAIGTIQDYHCSAEEALSQIANIL